MKDPAPKTRRILLTDTHLVAVGPYYKDVEYDVPADLAATLVERRGFRYVDAGPVAAPVKPLKDSES